MQHVGLWAIDRAMQHHPSDIVNSAHQLGTTLPFSYTHTLQDLAGENYFWVVGENSDVACSEQCYDVCDQQLGLLTDRKSELALLIQAIDELQNLGEVKHWIDKRGKCSLDTKYCKIKSICLWKKPSWAIKRMVELFYLLVFDIRPRSYCTYIHLVKPATFETIASKFSKE